MNTLELRELYDQQLRRYLTTPDMQREELPHLVRHTNEAEKWGFISYSRLNEQNADQVIAEQVDHFRALKMGFEWKYYSHDTPPDLKDRLIRAGAVVDEDEAIMVLDIADAAPRLLEPATLDIRKVKDSDGLDSAMRVAESAHGHMMQSTQLSLQNMLRDHPDHLAVYTGYDGSQIVAVGWAFLYRTVPWAGLYGGGTLESHRGRGYYTALLAARLQEAQSRGARFLVVDAGSMSRPILEKLGFRQITVSNPCEFEYKEP